MKLSAQGSISDPANFCPTILIGINDNGVAYDCIPPLDPAQVQQLYSTGEKILKLEDTHDR
ncbi:hypothetical protein [Pararhizobium sp. IMCC21322]|uniref:hypothetical protein n=1 Tax=Pararhizobium sp. IMCC21322 TaxID=3067903 RepID=UPI0027419943|nr:hypothetical protein [Pararhizobium sp. IMCC21322]